MISVVSKGNYTLKIKKNYLCYLLDEYLTSILQDDEADDLKTPELTVILTHQYYTDLYYIQNPIF